VGRRQSGQVGAEFGLALAFMVTLGVATLQVAGLGLDVVKISHAAQEAAYVAGSLPEADRTAGTPCWAISGGLSNPGGYADAPVCRTVVENLGSLDPQHASLSLTQDGERVHVTVTFAEPVTSPLLRLFMGPTFTTTQDAWSQ
jgi:hypothetical protein